MLVRGVRTTAPPRVSYRKTVMKRPELSAYLIVLASCALVPPAGCNRQDTSGRSADTQPAGDVAPAPAAPARTPLPEIDTSKLFPKLEIKIGAARQAARTNPDDPEKVGELGALCFTHGLLDAALACFRRNSELRPDQWEWWYCVGRTQELRGEPAAAIPAYEQTLKLEPRCAPAALRLGALKLERDPAAAKALFQSAAELEPNNPVPVYGLGLVAAREGRPAEAADYYRKALELLPDYMPAHAALAAVREAEGKPEEAAWHRRIGGTDTTLIVVGDPIEFGLRLKGLDVQILLNEALTLAQQGRTDRADDLLLQAIDLDSTGVNARNTLGWVRLQQRRLNEAEEQFRAALKAEPQAPPDLQPAFAVVRSNLAEVLMLKGETEEAERLLRAALEQRPTELQTLDRFARLLGPQRRVAEVAAVLQRALAAAPDDARLHGGVGDLYIRLARFDDAIAALERATQLAPQFAHAWYTLGLAHRARGALDLAEQVWRRALAAAPTYLPARMALVGVSLARSDYAGAVALVKEGIEANPNELELINGLAWLLATCPAEGVRDGRRAVELAEQTCKATSFRNHVYLDTLAAAYAEAGDFTEALKTVGQAIRLAREGNDAEALRRYQERQALYQQNRPYRDRTPQ